ncbi:MAG: hypothetical protein K1V71_09135 [Paramuribaculum sp.]
MLLWLTLSPDPLPDNKVQLWEGADKMAHALMFGGLTAIFMSDTFRRRPLNILILLVIFAVGIASGAAIEMLQRAMGLGRQAERADFYADALGVVAAGGAWLLGRFSHK